MTQAANRRLVGVFREGALAGLRTAWELSKMMVPVYLAVSLLNLTSAFHIFSQWVEPAMKLFGLPGKAAVVLVAGWFLSFYGSLGAMAGLGLTAKQITTIGLMLGFCHTIPVEGVILHKMGAGGARITLIRMLTACLAGILINLVWRGR